jgi:pyrimidine and pyridine-specific 5'-nucleotidase
LLASSSPFSTETQLNLNPPTTPIPISLASSQVFFDDSARNIAAGKAAGFRTVIVSVFSVSSPRVVRACVLQSTADADNRQPSMHGNLRMQVGSSALVPGADVALESIHNIKEALPELWEAAAGSGGDRVEAVLRSTTAVETTVIA